MSLIIVFALGYFLGGLSALVLLSLALVSRRGDRALQQDEQVGPDAEKYGL